MSDQVQQIAMRIHDLRDVSNYTVEQVAKNTGVSEEEYLSYESGAVDIPSFMTSIPPPSSPAKRRALAYAR